MDSVCKHGTANVWAASAPRFFSLLRNNSIFFAAPAKIGAKVANNEKGLVYFERHSLKKIEFVPHRQYSIRTTETREMSAALVCRE